LTVNSMHGFWHEARLASTRMVFSALCLTVLAAGCTPAPNPEIRIGTNIWPGYEPLYLARSLGWLKDSGIRLIEFTSSTETMNSLRHGSIEAGALTLDEVLTLAQDGVNLRVVLVLDVSNGADAVVAQPDIAGVKGLRGRTIGTESTAVGGYMVDRMLEKSGLSLSDIHILPLMLDEHEAAFTARQVDAVVTFEPVKSHLLARGGKVIFDSSLIPGEIIDVLAVRSESLKRAPKSFAYLADSWYRALDYMRRQPDDAALRMRPRLNLTPDQLLLQYTGLNLGNRQLNQSFFGDTDNPPAKRAANLTRIMRKNGLLHHDVDVSQLFIAEPIHPAARGDLP